MGKSKRRKDRSSTPAAPKNPTEAEKPRGVNPREALFEVYYRDGGPGFRVGKAYRSALAAGYSPITAKPNCRLLGRKARVHVAEVLQALGVNGFSQAKKLLELREEKTVRWNSKREKWDTFEDVDVQLRTDQEINRILDACPAPRESIDSRDKRAI